MSEPSMMGRRSRCTPSDDASAPRYTLSKAKTDQTQPGLRRIFIKKVNTKQKILFKFDFYKDRMELHGIKVKITKTQIFIIIKNQNPNYSRRCCISMDGVLISQATLRWHWHGPLTPPLLPNPHSSARTHPHNRDGE